MRRGPLLMIVAALFFSLMIAAVKVAREQMTSLDVIVWRAIIAVPLALAFARQAGARLRIGDKRLLALRICLGFAAMNCFYTAARGLAVTDIALFARLQPIGVAVFAPFFLGRTERVGRIVWVALLGGLAGSAILIAPELAIGSSYGLFAMFAAILSAGAHTAIRKLNRTEDPEAIVVWFQVGLAVLSVVGCLAWFGRLPLVPSRELWAPVLAVGVCATLGQVFMTKAYRHDRAALVAGASYAGPLWAVAIDLVAFGSLPTAAAVAGGSLIVVSGLVFLRR